MDFYSLTLWNFVNYCDDLRSRQKQGRLSQSYGGRKGVEI
jgi:ligand-binding sensor protein